MASKKTPKNAEKYVCEKCDFKCSKQSEYTRHIMTAKHKQAYTCLQDASKKTPKSVSCDNPNDNVHTCACGMVYVHRQSLYRHQKRCIENEKNAENAENSAPPENRVVHESISDSTLMRCFHTMMEAQSHTMQTMMDTQVAAQTAAIEQAAQIQAKRDEATTEQTRLLLEAITLNGPQCITNNNTTNNQFNLNVFLNEDCKDAYTLKEVMDSIECTVTDLDRMDHDGYVATITRKILESIQDMAITERPIHCTDARRNTVCVKDDTGWEKNDKAMKMLANSVYKVGQKLGRMVDDWRLVYPDHFRGTVTRREQYHRLISDIMKVHDSDVEARITSKVCKGVILDRKMIIN